MKKKKPIKKKSAKRTPIKAKMPHVAKLLSVENVGDTTVSFAGTKFVLAPAKPKTISMSLTGFGDVFERLLLESKPGTKLNLQLTGGTISFVRV